MVISGKMTTFAAIIITIRLKNVTTPMKKNHLIMSTLLFCGLEYTQQLNGLVQFSEIHLRHVTIPEVLKHLS